MHLSVFLTVTCLLSLLDLVHSQQRCGRDFNNAVCTQSGYLCCSQYGWCGATRAHCGAGCQIGCNNRDPYFPGTLNLGTTSSSRSSSSSSTSRSATSGTSSPSSSVSGSSSNSNTNTAQSSSTVRTSSSSSSTSSLPTTTPQSSSTTSQSTTTSTTVSVPLGRCGQEFGGALCTSPGYYCCSEWGYCGATSAHCGTGCQSGCNNQDPLSSSSFVSTTAASSQSASSVSNAATSLSAPSSSQAVSTSQTASSISTSTSSSSSAAVSTTASSTSSTAVSTTTTLPTAPYGRCGSEFGGAVCTVPGNFCCSQWGYCGNTPEFCGTGCQSACNNQDPRNGGGSVSSLPEIDENGAFLSCRVPGSIAITYDDGPSQYTATLLQTMRNMNLKTTFFVIGSQISYYPSVLLQAFSDGHDIASHTWSHPSLPSLSNAQIVDEVKRTEDAIFSVTGRRPRLFRPPYGDLDARVASIITGLGYKIVKWNLDTDDWRHPTDYQASLTQYQNALGGADPTKRAFISLQHDIHQGTVQFAQNIHQYCISAGFSPQTVSTCLQESAYM
ncbi:hypothetical protein BKA69DRAFT_1045246 [Paraphysoderma sedebokerense]|nr:hypothetical protein BKA69DRAFT_1045246 [Paraphysoderma sedebokerense]